MLRREYHVSYPVFGAILIMNEMHRLPRASLPSLAPPDCLRPSPRHLKQIYTQKSKQNSKQWAGRSIVQKMFVTYSHEAIRKCPSSRHFKCRASSAERRAETNPCDIY